MSRSTAIRAGLWTAAVVASFLMGVSKEARAAAGALDSVAGAPPGEATPMPYYDFQSPNPRGGFCEQQTFGRGQMLAEPRNAVFSVTTFVLGLIGLVRSKRSAMAFQFMYGLLAAYGLFAVLYHATLTNGFYRMQDVAVSMVQSFVIIMLVHALYLYRVKLRGRGASKGYRVVAILMTLIFTAYPAAVHVAGESSADPWVSWLVFDLLWILIAALLIAVWQRRATWPGTSPNTRAFRLVPYAIGWAFLAYVGWSTDKFLCRPMVAYFCLHAWWDLFMGLCFYYLITLCRFFSAHEYGFEPVLEYIPATGPVRLPFVEWKSRRRVPTAE
jgi:hypothetical protein